jgi:hypothetical protein
MKKIAEIFRKSCQQNNIQHYYYGNVQAGSLDVYIPEKKAYQYLGKIKDFPFFACMVESKESNIYNRTDTYTISLHYGELPDASRLDTAEIFEHAEHLIISVINKAKEISETERLFFSFEEEITFEYNTESAPTRFLLTSVTIKIITT